MFQQQSAQTTVMGGVIDEYRELGPPGFQRLVRRDAHNVAVLEGHQRRVAARVRTG
jgi:hypothetical protein